MQRSRIRTLAVVVVVVAGSLLLGAQAAHAVYYGSVLNVAFQGSLDTQAGFQPMDTNPKSFSTPIGSVTVTLTGDSFYDRGAASPANAGAFTYSALYHDFWYVNGSATLPVTISGLPVGQEFQLRIYSYDYNNGAGTRTVTFTPVSGTLGAAGATSYTPGVTPLTNFESSALVNWTSNGSGQIAFEVGESTGFTRINGLELTAVPEPSSALFVLLAAGGGTLMGRSRSRKE